MAVNQYQRKPVVLNAVQWTGSNAEEIEMFCGVVAGLDTLAEGSYIIRNEKGRLEVYSPSAFYEVFERRLVWDDNI